jgi:hypothetical protein
MERKQWDADLRRLQELIAATEAAAERARKAEAEARAAAERAQREKEQQAERERALELEKARAAEKAKMEKEKEQAKEQEKAAAATQPAATAAPTTPTTPAAAAPAAASTPTAAAKAAVAVPSAPSWPPSRVTVDGTPYGMFRMSLPASQARMLVAAAAAWSSLRTSADPQVLKSLPSWSTIARETTKSINRAAGQVSASVEQVSAVAGRLAAVVQGVGAGGAPLDAYVKLLMVERLVEQAEMFRAKTEPAFPLASAIVVLCARDRSLGRLVRARLLHECPWSQCAVALDDPEHFGRKENETDETRFGERMSGYIALTAAIYVSPPLGEGSAGAEHPFGGVGGAWTFLACQLNAPPQRLSATLLHTFLNITSSTLAAAFGQQFLKLLRLVKTQYVPTLSSDPALRPANRKLELLVDQLLTGDLPEMPIIGV